MKITYEWQKEYCGMLASAVYNDELIKWKLYSDDLTIRQMREDFEKISNERLKHLDQGNDILDKT